MPNPDKPELNIDDLRLKICGIALRGVGATTPTSRRLRSVFSIKIDRIPLRAGGPKNQDMGTELSQKTGRAACPWGAKNTAGDRQEVIVESRNYQERPRKDKKIDGRTISEELGNCHRSSR